VISGCPHVAFDVQLSLQVILTNSMALALGFALLLNLRMRLSKLLSFLMSGNHENKFDMATYLTKRIGSLFDCTSPSWLGS